MSQPAVGGGGGMNERKSSQPQRPGEKMQKVHLKIQIFYSRRASDHSPPVRFILATLGMKLLTLNQNNMGSRVALRLR